MFIIIWQLISDAEISFTYDINTDIREIKTWWCDHIVSVNSEGNHTMHKLKKQDVK